MANNMFSTAIDSNNIELGPKQYPFPGVLYRKETILQQILWYFTTIVKYLTLL